MPAVGRRAPLKCFKKQKTRWPCRLSGSCVTALAAFITRPQAVISNRRDERIKAETGLGCQGEALRSSRWRPAAAACPRTSARDCGPCTTIIRQAQAGGKGAAGVDQSRAGESERVRAFPDTDDRYGAPRGEASSAVNASPARAGGFAIAALPVRTSGSRHPPESARDPG